MERMKQVYQQMAKYQDRPGMDCMRVLVEEVNFPFPVIPQDAGGSAISNMLAKARASAQAITEHQNGSPSPTTILKSVNSSGHYMCSQQKNTAEMPSPIVIYNETVPEILPPNLMQHRNNNVCLPQDNNNQFEYDESDENSSQYPQYNNNAYNFSQNLHQNLDESQQQADQKTIELRMNNLSNEDV